MGTFIDLTGQKFGRLVAVSRAENIGRRTMWKCLCDCGVETIVQSDHIKSGHSKSCGCFYAETRTGATTHGQSESPLYFAWHAMLNRCNSPTNQDYKYYGGRGIAVCEEWKKFENFYADMGERPEGMTLDRIDNSGPYCKENCRWATDKQQQSNKRSNTWHTFDGETLHSTDFAKKLGVSHSHISYWKRVGYTDSEMIARANNLN